MRTRMYPKPFFPADVAKLSPTPAGNVIAGLCEFYGCTTGETFLVPVLFDSVLELLIVLLNLANVFLSAINK